MQTVLGGITVKSLHQGLHLIDHTVNPSLQVHSLGWRGQTSLGLLAKTSGSHEWLTTGLAMGPYFLWGLFGNGEQGPVGL